MRILHSLIVTLLAIIQVSAGLPSRGAYRTYSENGLYYLRGITFGSGSDTGKTEVFRADSTLLYRIDKYQSNGYLSNDGHYIVTYSDRILRGRPTTEPLVTILRDGQAFRQIPVQQLVDTTNLKWGLAFADYTGSAVWEKRVFMHDDTLYVLTVEKKAAIIDIRNGTVLSLEPDSAVLKRFRTSMPRQRTEFLNIAYPHSYQIPPLSDQRPFIESIASEFGITDKNDCKDCKTLVSIEIVITREGTARLHSFSGYNNAPAGMQQKLTHWISSHTFDTSQVPKECEQWLFNDFFFIDRTKR